MSLEKRRDTREVKKEKVLEASSFRKGDFTPLQKIKEKKEKIAKVPDEKIDEKIEVIDELTEIEKDVLEVAKSVLKLKRYVAEFEIESESQIQKFPIIEKLYAKCIAKLSYSKGYSKEQIFLGLLFPLSSPLLV